MGLGRDHWNRGLNNHLCNDQRLTGQMLRPGVDFRDDVPICDRFLAAQSALRVGKLAPHHEAGCRRSLCFRPLYRVVALLYDSMTV